MGDTQLREVGMRVQNQEILKSVWTTGQLLKTVGAPLRNLKQKVQRELDKTHNAHDAIDAV